MTLPIGIGTPTVKPIGGEYLLRYDPKRSFFDRAAIQRAVDNTSQRVLSRFGAYVRTRAMGSIRSSDTISKPGSPPHSHVGAHCRRLNKDLKAQGKPPVTGGFKGIKEIYFVYDRGRKSVIIGPVIANHIHFTNDKHRRPVSGTVPEVLEYGGDITIMEVELGAGYWIRADLRSRRALGGRRLRYTTKHVRARPFMNPVLKNELPKLPAMWANAIK